MWKVELALTRILGVKPAWMRPPYGNYNDLVRQASLIRNQSLVIWDFDDGDSVGATVAQSEQDYTDLANRHPNNVLALNHETYKTTAYVLPDSDLNTEYASANVFPLGSEQVLPFAIQKLKAKGYTFKTVAECLGMPAYASVGTPGTKDVSSSSLSIYQSLGLLTSSLSELLDVLIYFLVGLSYGLHELCFVAPHLKHYRTTPYPFMSCTLFSKALTNNNIRNVVLLFDYSMTSYIRFFAPECLIEVLSDIYLSRDFTFVKSTVIFLLLICLKLFAKLMRLQAVKRKRELMSKAFLPFIAHSKSI